MQGTTPETALDAYLPRLLLQRLHEAPDEGVHTTEATVVFVDVSGFTRLSERLARRGKEGAEHLTYAINACFRALLEDAWQHDGSLLKFGGDALLIWFEGDEHTARACCSASRMRATLRQVSVQEGLTLRMSVGVHSGEYETFLVGGSHRELIITGPAISRVVEMEAAAAARQILLSPETAARLPRASRGRELGPGVLLARAPRAASHEVEPAPPGPGLELVAGCLSTALRAHLLSAPGAAEHRTATIGFLQFGETDALLARAGREALRAALDGLLREVQAAADHYEVCLLGSDVTGNGGKLILTGGVPRVVGDDEERMLLAARQILDAEPPLPIRFGVNRGQVFAGEIGPGYRRTYTVMGDAVNLAARLMAKAEWGTLLASREVLECSQASFATEALPPFPVKGKLRPVEAARVGSPQRAAAAPARAAKLPLVGRERELGVLRRAVARVREGQGALVELVGEIGSGKSRLLAETRVLASELRPIHVTCQSYTRTTAYAAARDLMRQLLDLPWNAPAQEIRDRLAAEARRVDPGLEPWLPLLGIALDLPMPLTREVEELSESARPGKLHEVAGRLLSAQREIPTLVQLEHCQHMDEASAELVRALTESLLGATWLVIVTRDAVDAGFRVPDWAPTLELGPLSEAEMLALAEASPAAELVPPHVLQTAVQRAEGSPEFMLDLLAAAASGRGSLPESFESAAAARLDALDPGDRVLVRRAAVLGVSFRPEHLVELLDPGHREPDLETWTRLEGVFAHDPDGSVRFKRPILREVAYHGLPFSLRRELHARVARRLERDSTGPDPAVLSLHFVLAGDMESAWIYSRIAAQRDAARFAQAEAARLWRRAIEAGGKAGVPDDQLVEAWEGLVTTLVAAGELGAAGEAVRSARRLVRDAPLAQVRLLHRQATIAYHAGRLTAAVRAASAGLRLAGNEDGKEAGRLRAQLMAELGWIRLRQARFGEAERLCRDAAALAERAGEQRALGQALYNLDMVLVELGRAAEARNSAGALPIFEALGDLEQQANVQTAMALAAQARSELDVALGWHNLAASSFERAGIPAGVAVAVTNVAWVQIIQGAWEEARSHLDRARRLSLATGFNLLPVIDYLLASAAIRGGDASAVPLLRAAIGRLEEAGEAYYAEDARVALAEAEALVGDAEEAIRLTVALEGGARRNRPVLRRVQGLSLIRLGDVEAGVRELREALSEARRLDDPVQAAAVLDALTRVEDAPGLLSERNELLDRLGIQRLAVLPALDGVTAAAAV